MGFRFPSIGLHKKLSQLLVEEAELRPQTQHYSYIFRDYTFKLKIKNKKKESVAKIISQKLWALISIKTGYNGL